MSTPPKTDDVPPRPSAVELKKILTLDQVTELTTLSADSLKRHHADKIRRLGPRRLGMRLGDALAIGNPHRKPETAAPACAGRMHRDDRSPRSPTS
jgi:hypothetical protein